MDITQLRYFLKTAELLNYSRAAESLFITRQSLRQAIASMEGELGAPLFHNERNHLSLTECGSYLALAGAEVVCSFDEVWADTVRLASQQVGLTVAFSESLVPLLLPDLPEVFQRFRSQFPHIPLEVLRWDTDRAIEAAEAGEVDCALVLRMPCEHPGCRVQVLTGFPVALDYGENFVSLQGHPQQSIKLEELEGLPCIGMGSFPRFMRPLWEKCQARGIRPDYRAVPNTIDAFYQIQNGLAAGFDILEDGSLGNRPIYSLPLPGYTFELVLLCPQGRPDSGPAQLLCQFLAEELRPPFSP